MRNELKSTLVMDRLKLHRAVKSTVNGKEFQTLTRLAKKVTTNARTTDFGLASPV